MEHGLVLHYEIDRLLGRGGMGEVYEARDTRLGRRVALKFIAPALAGDPEVVRRFEREAHASAVLSHPHIATLYALERDGARLFMVTELLPGGSLRERLRRRPPEVAEALGLARDVAAALAHAHQRGIAHRDIKPENLMFAADGTIKVTDFGLAQIAHASQLTAEGATLGTASYMAPESVRGHGDARADVFALGVVLYEMLAARLPYTADKPLSMMYEIVNGEPLPLRASRPDLPPEIPELVMSLLTRDPTQRPGSSAALVRLSELTGVVPPPQGDPAPTRHGSSGAWLDSDAPTMDFRNPGRPPARGFPRFAWPAIAVGVLALGWLGFQALRPGGRPPGAATQNARTLRARTLADEAAQFLTRGLLDSAESRASAALAIDPGGAGARINLAQVLRQRGEPTRAAALLSAVTKDPAADRSLRGVAWEALGDMAMEDQTWPEAVRALEQSFALDSTERAYSQLGYAMVRAARPEQALALLRRGVAVFPGSAALHKNAGYALLQLDSLRAARAEADRAIALDPGFGPALGLRARLEARAGDRSGARRDWQGFLAAHPLATDSAEVAADLQRVAGIR